MYKSIYIVFNEENVFIDRIVDEVLKHPKILDFIDSYGDEDESEIELVVNVEEEIKSEDFQHIEGITSIKIENYTEEDFVEPYDGFIHPWF